MGLDITTYRKLEKQPVPEDRHDTVLFWARENTDFPGRIEGVEHGAFYSFAEEFRFRAGSYSGYNVWREQLAELAGYPQVGAHKPYSTGAWESTSGPFWELINFADNEGVIGPVVAKKLARDFAEHQSKADAHPDQYFRVKYSEWRRAFEMAADGGAVDFH